MVKFQRLSPSERKKQICSAAKDVFLEKGFKDTTMEDVIEKSGMSKGGVYNYYKSTSDMLYDLIYEGIFYRLKVSDTFIETHRELSPEEILVELFLYKMFDYNDYKPLYAMFIVEMGNNERFKELYHKMQEEGLKIIIPYFKDKLPEINLEYIFSNPGIMAFINSVIIGVELLDLRNDFLKDQDMFREMIKAYLKYCEEKYEK